MEQLLLAPTKSTPEIKFLMDGNLLIKGRSLPEDTAKFYDPLHNWIENCYLENICITICLDYMNSSSSQQISKFLQQVKNNTHIKNCLVKWYYEEGDEDNLDFGREVMQLIDLPFQFFETAEFIGE
jgi:hypothetical protein